MPAAGAAVSGDEQDAADGLTALDVGMGSGGLGQREAPVDDGLQVAAGHLVEQLGDAGAYALGGHLHGQGETDQRAVAGDERGDVDLGEVAPGVADEGDPTLPSEAGDARLEGGAAVAVEHEVDALAAGDPLHLLDGVVVAVVDA